MTKKIKLLNGPLHGLEIVTDSNDFIDLLDGENGKVRRYALGDFAHFIKEWPNQEARNKEVFGEDGILQTHEFYAAVMYGKETESCSRCGLGKGSIVHDNSPRP